MKKIENCRTLCDYYNEIVYKVNQLTEMCGNTDEAIKLRDDIDDMFTVKFSEPLYDVSDLQEQIGCPLEKISTTNEIYSDLDGKMKKFEIIGINFCEKKIYFWMDFAPMYLEFDEYKKSWWLREDRSE